MTLKEFSDKACSNRPAPATIYVFDTRDSAEDFMNGGNGFELTATIQSDFVMDTTFKQGFCDEKVYGFFAKSCDEFVVVLEKDGEK